jgi:hypothetical protein
MNFFRRGTERDFSVPPFDLHDGVKINNLEINGNKVNTPDGPRIRNDMGTVQVVELPQPVEPGKEASVNISWEVQLPQKVSIRMGQYGENNWFVAYWYPQIAVYDDISGWDTHPFTGSAEFYNDFSSYDVTLEVPQDYMVWATGVLQSPEKYYQPGVLNRYQQAHQTDSVIHIVTEEDIENNRVLTGQNSWNYVAEKVPDFAFAVSSEYLWDGTSILLDSAKNERIFVNAAYKKNSKDFHKVTRISWEIMKLFSDGIMQADYPYPEMTAFNGRGGMEFPMMINDGDASSHIGTVHLTAHEIGHNYFPFYVMTNESYYAFMDEGLISFLPRLAEEEMLQDYEPFEDLVTSYEFSAGSMKEVPLMVKSYMISDYSAYRTHAYTRPGVAFYLLKEMLGEEKFSKGLKAYVDRWKWKHPTPYDFFFTFEDVLNIDLSWFWNPWFFEFGYPDLAIEEVKKIGQAYHVTIRKKGNLPVPVKIKVNFADGTSEKMEASTMVWKNKDQHTFQVQSEKVLESIELGGPKIPDIFENNNTYFP